MCPSLPLALPWGSQPPSLAGLYSITNPCSCRSTCPSTAHLPSTRTRLRCSRHAFRPHLLQRTACHQTNGFQKLCQPHTSLQHRPKSCIILARCPQTALHTLPRATKPRIAERSPEGPLTSPLQAFVAAATLLSCFPHPYGR